MRILENIGRAIIKLALFALFAYLLARPYAVAVVSLITERLPGPVEFVSVLWDLSAGWYFCLWAWSCPIC